MKKIKKDIKRLVAPHLLTLIKDKKVNVSKDIDMHIEVRDKLVKCLEKRKLEVFDAGIQFADDKGNPENFVIEYIYKDKVILLEGKVVNRYQYVEVA